MCSDTTCVAGQSVTTPLVTLPVWLGSLSPHVVRHYLCGWAVRYHTSSDTTCVAGQSITTCGLTLPVWLGSPLPHLYTTCVAGQSITTCVLTLPVWLGSPLPHLYTTCVAGQSITTCVLTLPVWLGSQSPHLSQDAMKVHKMWSVWCSQQMQKTQTEHLTFFGFAHLSNRLKCIKKLYSLLDCRNGNNKQWKLNK